MLTSKQQQLIEDILTEFGDDLVNGRHVQMSSLKLIGDTNDKVCALFDKWFRDKIKENIEYAWGIGDDSKRGG